MSGITAALHNAASGLAATQRALDVVSGNISNANNTTYSRKHVEFESLSLNGLGAGVKVGAIQRSIDENLLRAARESSTKLNTLTGQTPFRERLQEMFGRPEDNSSLSHRVNAIEQALEKLAAAPERVLEQTNLVYNARDFAYLLNDMTETMQELRTQADKDIEIAVAEINRLTQKIDTLNDDIVAFSAVSRDTTDMEDDRDAALTELSALIDVNYFSRADGDVAVFTAKGATLVDKSAHKLSHSSVAASDAYTTYAGGGYSGIYAGAEVPGNDITDLIGGGKIKALLDIRDKVVPRLQAQTDELASEMRQAFNRVHNRGAPFPGMQTAEGTRTFTDPANQTIQIQAPSDTAVILFDGEGSQQAATTLNAIMTTAVAAPALPALADHGSWSIGDVAARMQNWFRTNGADGAVVNINAAGKFTVNMNTTELNFALRDQTAADGGADHEDAVIYFDNNGDGLTDESAQGFSNFLGLNDFFVTGREENAYQSETQPARLTVSAGSLFFRGEGGQAPAVINPAGLIPAPAAGELVLNTAGMTLQEIADEITDRVTGITATVTPDGAGERLTIRSDDSSEFTVADSDGVLGNGSVLAALGLHLSDAGVSRTTAVRADLLETPGRISRGAPQWDGSRNGGEYIMSIGDGRIAAALAEVMTDPGNFDAAGGFQAVSTSFSEYATQIAAADAIEARNNERAAKVQGGLAETLEKKHKNESGVNLDEEMSLLIVYEQSYAASARVISTIQRMFDALERAF